MCAGCGRRFAKAALVRFTVRETAEGRELALGGSSGDGWGGRGGYVCASLDCYDRAFSRKTLVRRMKVSSESKDLREEFARLIEARQRQE
ncbi:MAG: DUF448 domain-containing protein [Thermoleophilia bacterium]|nr:DUF448 domain-containing protein [Thermoleophilia bacterium]